MGSELPAGTTPPRGLPDPSSIRWPLVAARDLFALQYGRALVETNRRPGGVPVYGTNGQCGNHDSALFRGPGVILGRKGQGPLGVEWCPSDYWVIDTAYSLAPLRDDIDLRYAYYLIKFVGLNHLKDGTSNPTLSRDSFGSQAFPLPPLAEQRRIADMLAAFDDKIELNRRMSQTLESMARALFKSWFVDFDPVRAKAEGRDPGLTSDIAELFPDSFEDTEGGEIPMGWRTCGLDEIADFRNGLALQRFPANDGGALPVIKIAQLHAGTTEGADQASTDIPRAYVVQDGDVLFSWSGSLSVELWCGGPGALNQHLFKVTSERYPKWFYYLWTRQYLADFREIAAGKATTMGHIQRGHLTAARALVPPDPLVDLLGSHLDALLSAQVECRVQARILSDLRQSLLPGLLSGGLASRVREVAQ